MIGNAEWFGRRKYSGWGFSPRTWQGWVYIAAIAGLVGLVQILPFGGDIKFYAMIAIGVVFVADFIHIALTMKKDERERLHEALAERNALWAMLLVLIIGVAYQVASGVVANMVAVDPWILGALGAALLAKIATNLYLEAKD